MTPLLRIRVALMLTTYPVDPDLPDQLRWARVQETRRPIRESAWLAAEVLAAAAG